MVYINENKLNKGYINEYNKAYIGDKLLYWNADKYNYGGGEEPDEPSDFVSDFTFNYNFNYYCYCCVCDSWWYQEDFKGCN